MTRQAALFRAHVLGLVAVAVAGCAGGPAPGTWSDELATLDPAPGASFPAAFDNVLVTLRLDVGAPDAAWAFEPCGEVPADIRQEDPNAFTATDVTCAFPNGITVALPELDFLLVANDPAGETGVINVGGTGTASFPGGAGDAEALLQGSLAPE